MGNGDVLPGVEGSWRMRRVFMQHINPKPMFTMYMWFVKPEERFHTCNGLSLVLCMDHWQWFAFKVNLWMNTRC